jgi:hypothetical protein
MAKKINKKTKDSQSLKLVLASEKEKTELQKLSTAKLIIWIVGRSNELAIPFSNEDIVIESWLINPQKHSMRKFIQYPDSHVIVKRIGEMKGKKGLLTGSETIGYKLTDISKVIYANIIQQILTENIKSAKGKTVANRVITSIDETPYNRLRKTSAYIKFQQNRLNEIVESDFLYFYGINWHSKKSFIQNRYKNVDAVIKRFLPNDSILQGLIQYFSEHFSATKKQLIEQ